MKPETFVIAHNSFEAEISWNEEDELYVGRLQLTNIRHSACFSSSSAEGLEGAMKEAIAEYQEALEEFGSEWDIAIIF